MNWGEVGSVMTIAPDMSEINVVIAVLRSSSAAENVGKPVVSPVGAVCVGSPTGC